MITERTLAAPVKVKRAAAWFIENSIGPGRNSLFLRSVVDFTFWVIFKSRSKVQFSLPKPTSQRILCPKLDELILLLQHSELILVRMYHRLLVRQINPPIHIPKKKLQILLLLLECLHGLCIALLQIVETFLDFWLAWYEVTVKQQERSVLVIEANRCWAFISGDTSSACFHFRSLQAG